MFWVKVRFLSRCCCVQCDKIWQFLKGLANKFAYKSSPKRLLTFGLFWKRPVNVKSAWILFRQLLETFGHLVTLVVILQCTNQVCLGEQLILIEDLFLKWAIPVLFFFIFVFSTQKINDLSMTGFKPRTSGVGSDYSTNWATTTVQEKFSFCGKGERVSFEASG